VSTAEDTAKAIILTGSDPEGSNLTYTVVSNPAHGTLSGTAPSVTYTPAANYNGADSFTFRASDGKTNSNVATVSITVTAVNDAPKVTASGTPTSGTAPLAVNFTATGTDVDGDALTYAWTFGDGSASSPQAAGTASHTYATAGTYTATVTVSDGKGGTASASVTISVISGAGGGGVSATGGTVTNYTENGTNWTAHIFRNVGSNTLSVSSGGAASVLVVAGGGGGGNNGGGGGAGGLVYSNGFPLVAGTYTVSVGGGGAASTGGSGGNGTNSVFSNSGSSAIVAMGGGGGAALGNIGLNGGSGGGGGGVLTAPANSGGTHTAGQGNMGGSGGVLSGNWGGNGGGGGAGSAGLPGDNSSNGGNGGAGAYVSVFTGLVASTVGTTDDGWFAGGGGGAEVNGTAAGAGGRGGGGRSNKDSTGTAGSTNTGGGGGGGCWDGSSAHEGGNGGSGIVIIRYVTSGGVVNPDANGNGMPDAWEMQYFGGPVDPSADPDGDRMNNLQEYLANTIPTNRLSLLCLKDCESRMADGGFVIRWQSASNRWYTVQAATNLLTGFAPISGASNIPATYPVNVYTDGTANVGMKFYRIRVQE
jgi:PKD repeat protein